MALPLSHACILTTVGFLPSYVITSVSLNLRLCSRGADALANSTWAWEQVSWGCALQAELFERAGPRGSCSHTWEPPRLGDSRGATGGAGFGCIFC